MTKYAVVEFEYIKDYWQGPLLDCTELYSDISDIKEAEGKRWEYLKENSVNPQNVQVIQYAE